MAETTEHLVAFQYVPSGRNDFRTVQAGSQDEARASVMERVAGPNWRQDQAQNPTVKITATVPNDRSRPVSQAQRDAARAQAAPAQAAPQAASAQRQAQQRGPTA